MNPEDATAKRGDSLPSFDPRRHTSPDAPIEVMHVITSLDVGGAETVLTRLVTGDSAGPVSHRVVSLKSGGALRANLEEAGIPVHGLGIEGIGDVLGGLVRLVRIIRLEKPAVVHGWLYHAVLLATLALALSGRRSRTRLVWGVRCSDMDMRRYAWSARYVAKPLPFLSSKTDLVTYNSEAGRAVHERIGYRPPGYRVVPNGVDVDRFRPRPNERSAVRAEMGLGDEHFVVGMCARVDPMKDHENFVKAAVVFAATAPEARFVLVGAGTDRQRSRLDRMIAASGIEERFVRLGQRRDIGRIHAALDVATLSSAFGEGFSNVLAEAMACGVPCVATDVGDSASIVSDTGLVVPPRNAEALAAAWDSLRREGCDRRVELGTAARRRVASRYGLAAMMEAHRALYGELVVSGGTRGRRSGADPRPLGDRLARNAESTLRPIDAQQSDRPAGSDTRRRVRTALLIAATAVCMVLAIRAVDLGAVGEALGGVDPRHVALAVVMLLCNAFVAMVRFRYLLGGFGYSPAWQRLVAAFSVGLLGNQFVLNFIGQSLGRAGVLVSSGVPFGATVIATFFERLLAAALLGTAGLIAAWYLLPHFGFDFSHGGAYFVSLVGGMTLAAAVAGLAVSRRGTAARAVAVAARGVRRFWRVGLLTIVAHCFMLASYVVALFALGHETLTPEIVAAAIIVTFAAGLPFSLGGWGIRELSAVAAFGAVGVDPPMALAAGLLVGVCSFVVNLVVACPGLLLLPGRVPESPVKVDPASPDWDARLVVGCAALAAVTIFFQMRVQGGDGLVTANFADLLALIGLGSFLLLAIRSRDRFSGLPRPLIAALILLSLLFAYGLLLGYANFGATPWALLNRGFGWLVILGYVALGLAVAMLDAERARWLILRVLVAAGTVVAVLQLVFLVFLKFGFPPPEEVLTYPLEGYAYNVNTFGFQMAMTALAAILAHRFGVLGSDRRWLVAVLFLTGLVVFFTGSRTALGMFAVLLVLSVAFASPQERHRTLGAVLVATVFVALAAAAIANIPLLDNAPGTGAFPIRGVQSVVGSDSVRWVTFADGWRYWLERPLFGHGLGAYVAGQLAEKGHYLVFHSVPIWLMAEMGAVGLATGLAAFGWLALGAWRLMRDPRSRDWGVGLVMALICWGAGNLVHDFAFQRLFWFFAAFAFGCAAAEHVAARRRFGTEPSRERDAARPGWNLNDSRDANAELPEGGSGNMKRRLMIVVTEDWYLWSHRIGLAMAARDAGYEVTVVTRVGEYGDRIRALGLGLVDVDFARGRLSPWANLGTVRVLCDVYRRWAPDLVHHVALKPVVLGSVAAARTGVPAVVNALTGLGTVLLSDHPKARVARPILRPALGWALRRPRSCAVVQNLENTKFVESLGVPPDRISLVRGAGVDIRRFRPAPEHEGTIRVTMVSRLLRDKGVREFVEAASLVNALRQDVTFTLVGAPDEENPTSFSLEEVQSWHADGVVEWWGQRNDVEEILARSHVAVLPTYGEGIPLTLLEAAACGRPIVATDVPGCREVVRHEGNGLLVPARDARALAEAIVSLVDDPARRAAMGAEGRRRAETEFAAERIHAETLRVYERALASAGA